MSVTVARAFHYSLIYPPVAHLKNGFRIENFALLFESCSPPPCERKNFCLIRLMDFVFSSRELFFILLIFSEQMQFVRGFFFFSVRHLQKFVLVRKV